MGYDVLMMYGTWHPQNKFFKEVGRVELCKVGDEHMMNLVTLSHQSENNPKQQVPDSHILNGPVEVYYDSGDKTRDADNYGDKIWLLDVGEVIVALKKELAGEQYRRFELALAVLEVFNRTFECDRSEHAIPGVVLFGH